MGSTVHRVSLCGPCAAFFVQFAAVHDVARAVEEEAVEAALRERSSRRRSTAAGLDPGRSRRGRSETPHCGHSLSLGLHKQQEE
jgi:hypothetical protein